MNAGNNYSDLILSLIKSITRSGNVYNEAERPFFRKREFWGAQSGGHIVLYVFYGVLIV